MNGVHDMGGMQGLGAIAPEADEPVFHAAWEGRVLAMTVASPTRSNIDAGRHERELIPAADYLAMTYYEKWFTSLSALLVKHGLATPAEIAAGHAAPGAPKAEPRFRASDVPAIMSARGSYVREGPRPAFRVGDKVRARKLNPTGHTRLPRYVRGRVGEVTASHGDHVFPDANAQGRGEDPRPLYTVRFAATELWGEAANPRDCVSLDLWEPYLERA